MLKFTDTEWKKVGHLSKIFGRGCQNCFRCVQSYILRKKFEKVFEKTFYYFRKLSWNDFGICRKSRRGGQICIQCFQGKFLRNFCWKGNNLLHLFRLSSDNYLAFCQSLFDRVVKTAFYVSIGAIQILFWLSYFFWIFGQYASSFRPYAKNFSAFVKKVFGSFVEVAFYVSWGFLIGSCFSKNLNFSIVFGQWAEKIRSSV